MNSKPIDFEPIEIKEKDYNLFKLDLHAAVRILDESNARNSNQGLGKELWATLLLAMLLRKCNRPVCAIGFPCIKKKMYDEFEARIEQLKKLSVERSEFDTVLFYPKEDNGLEYYRIQIIRYVNQNYKDVNCLYRFLLEKKIKKYSPDKLLFLLIFIEDPIEFKYVELSELLINTEVPFANISAIGHIGPTEKHQYFGVNIYPKIEGPATIDLESIRLDNGNT